MDLTIETNTTISPCSKKSTPETDNDTPPQPHPVKPLSFGNCCSLRKVPYHLHRPPFAAVVSYKDCLKNHAASLGCHALDGCGEFMPSSTANPTDPTSLKCAACGCHRNFHRRQPDEFSSTASASAAAPHFLEFHHHPPPLLPPHSLSPSPSSSPSPSPPPPQRNPIHSYAPQMLLALSTAVAEENPTNPVHPMATQVTPVAYKPEHLSGRKRFRTKFTALQKEKMYPFSEKLGWKMQKCDENLVEEFCNEVGVAKNVLKVWMHNNKNTFGKKDTNSNNPTTTTAAAALPVSTNANGNGNGIVHHYDSNSHYTNNNNNSNSNSNNGHHGNGNGIGSSLHLQVSSIGPSSSS